MTDRSMKGTAQRQARHALLRKRITRNPCERCGALDGLHMHHEDYGKPLEIRWLCRSCHRQYHSYLDNTNNSIGILDEWISAKFPLPLKGHPMTVKMPAERYEEFLAYCADRQIEIEAAASEIMCACITREFLYLTTYIHVGAGI